MIKKACLPNVKADYIYSLYILMHSLEYINLKQPLIDCSTDIDHLLISHVNHIKIERNKGS